MLLLWLLLKYSSITTDETCLRCQTMRLVQKQQLQLSLFSEAPASPVVLLQNDETRCAVTSSMDCCAQSAAAFTSALVAAAAAAAEEPAAASGLHSCRSSLQRSIRELHQLTHDAVSLLTLTRIGESGHLLLHI